MVHATIKDTHMECGGLVDDECSMYFISIGCKLCLKSSWVDSVRKVGQINRFPLQFGPAVTEKT